MTDELRDDLADVEWEDGVRFVDTRVDASNQTDRQCDNCDSILYSVMAETDDANLGPAYVCSGCGLVKRI